MGLFKPGIVDGSLDLSLGDYFSALLRDWSYVLRRVESVRLLDAKFAERRISIDLDPHKVEWIANNPTSALDRSILTNPNLLPVPIAVLDKNLMMDFSLRDSAGRALSLPTREEDSYVAACVAAALMRLEGSELSEFREQLYSLAYKFPRTSDAFRVLLSGEDLSERSRPRWREILETNPRILSDFDQNFLLIAEVDPESSSALLKLSYQGGVTWEPLRSEKLGFKSASLTLHTPGANQGRSYHLRFEPPEGLLLVHSSLESKTVDRATNLKTFWRRQSPSQTHLYVSRLPQSQKLVGKFRFTAPMPGFLRTAMLSMVFITVLLNFVNLHYDQIREAAQHQADAVYAVLMAVPLVLVGYVVRPREHNMTNVLLRPTRLIVAASAVFPYLAALAMLPEFKGSAPRVIIWVAAAISLVPGVLLSLVAARTARDIYRAGVENSRDSQEIQIETFLPH